MSFFFFFNDTATTEIYTLSLHDALPISARHAAVLRHVEGLPEDLAALLVERHHAAAEGATGISRVGRQRVLDRRDADVDDALEHDRRARDHRCGMRIHLRDPLQLPVLAVHRDHVRAVVDLIRAEDVADDHLVAVERRAHARDGACDAVVLGDLVRPDETAALLLHGEEVAGPIGEVDRVTVDGRSGRDIAARRERPLRTQRLDVAGADEVLRRLVAAVAQVLSGDSPLAGFRVGRGSLRARCRRHHQRADQECDICQLCLALLDPLHPYVLLCPHEVRSSRCRMRTNARRTSGTSANAPGRTPAPSAMPTRASVIPAFSLWRFFAASSPRAAVVRFMKRTTAARGDDAAKNLHKENAGITDARVGIADGAGVRPGAFAEVPLVRRALVRILQRDERTSWGQRRTYG